MHSELSVALNKSDNKTENNTISSRLLVLLLSSLAAAAAAAIVPGVSSVCLSRRGGWWQALVKELAWQTAQCKSHTDQINTNITQQNTPMKTLPFCCFSFFFLVVLLFNVVLPLCCSYIFSPVLWMCGVSQQEKNTQRLWQYCINAAERVHGHKEQRESDINSNCNI